MLGCICMEWQIPKRNRRGNSDSEKNSLCVSHIWYMIVQALSRVIFIISVDNPNLGVLFKVAVLIERKLNALGKMILLILLIFES